MRYLVAATAALALVLTACGGGNDEPSLPEEPFDLGNIEGLPDEAREAFEAAGDDTTIPDDFPSDLPIPDAPVTRVQETGDLTLVLLAPEEDHDRLVESIQVDLRDSPWEITDTTEIIDDTQKATTFFTEKGGREALISVLERPPGTDAIVSVLVRPKGA